MATLTYFGFSQYASSGGVSSGLIANRPTQPVVVGTQYFATDDTTGSPDGTLYLSDGDEWIAVNGAATPLDLLFGTGAPSDGLGADSQYYLDKTAVNLYGPKASGAWPANKILLGALRENTGQVWIDLANMQTNINDGAAQIVSLSSYVDALAQGMSAKASVRLATAAALPTNNYVSGVLTATANGALTVDGSAVVVGNRILVKNEASALKNGIYVVTATGAGGTPYVLTRTTDMNANTEIEGAYCFVESGTVNDGLGFQVIDEGPYTLGTTAINWTQFSGAGQITAGTGVSKSGNTISLSSGSQTSLASADSAMQPAIYDANTIVKADSDNTPVALTMAASTILARLASGNIVAATVSQLKTLLAIAISDVTNLQTALDAKRDLIQRVSTLAASSNTYTPNCDTTDEALIVTPAANFTIAAPTGTPNDGQRLTLRIRSDATGRTPTWNSVYSGSGVAALITAALPSNNTLHFFFKYDLNALKWKLLAADTVGY